jgi:cyclase
MSKKTVKFARQAIIALLGMTIVGVSKVSVAQDQDFDRVQIKTVPVAENIYMLMGEGGNIGVSTGDDGILLIDDQFAPLTDKIETALSQISEQPVKFLFNTHWHYDHTGGNENFGKSGVTIVAHDEVRTRMSTDQFIEAFQRSIPASPPEALPTITFNDTATFYFNDQTTHAFHVTSAHTDGDTVIHFPEADVIHTGDIYFNGIYPFIDSSSGGSIAGMIQATEKILALAGNNTKIIPGHGSLSNRAELENYRKMLLDVKMQTEAAIAKNMTLEEFIASKPTAKYDANWGKGFLKPEQFLTIVYQSMAKP